MESGKLHILLTGATSGIGLALAKKLINTNHNLIFIASSFKKHENIINKLNQNNVKWFFCDLSLQKNIKETSNNIKIQYPKLDVIINCAGMLSSERLLTNEGIEKQLAVNHIAPFLLSELFLNNLIQSTHPKVINISSRAVYRSSINWEDLALSKKYSLTKAYNQSKLLSLMCSIAQSRTTPKVKYLNIYPGLVNTKIGEKNAYKIDGYVWKIIKKLGVSPEKAAESIFSLCFNSSKHPSGSLLSPKKRVRLPKKAIKKTDQEKVYSLTKAMIIHD